MYEKNLGGILIWENSADKPITNPRSLVAVLRDNLTHGKPPPQPEPQPEPPQPEPQPPRPQIKFWTNNTKYNVIPFKKKFP